MTRARLLQMVADQEDLLADAGLDNRHVPRRRMNSRRLHLGVAYLCEASTQRLRDFYFHLTEVQRRCEIEREINTLESRIMKLKGVLE
jgi:hypothetical protein